MQDGNENPAPAEARPMTKRLAACVRRGVVGGVRQAAWLLAVMLPISLVVTLLRFYGALGAVARLLEPAFRLIGLPGETAVACITAAAVNIYAGIAALGSIALTDRQVTILALFMLVCHNLPFESAVQHKAGASGWRVVVLRVTAAVVAAVVLNALLPAAVGEARTRTVAAEQADTLGALVAAWAVGTARFVGKVLLIVIGLMILHRALEDFGLARRLARLLAPVLWLMGLPRRTAFLWIVANTLGLAYGSAVIIEQSRNGRSRDREAALLNASIAVCHSLLEDTLLFVAIGAWALWITAPRVALAAAVAWGLRIWYHIRPSRGPEPAP